MRSSAKVAWLACSGSGPVRTGAGRGVEPHGTLVVETSHCCDGELFVWGRWIKIRHPPGIPRTTHMIFRG
jgi:hypothetical protein